MTRERNITAAVAVAVAAPLLVLTRILTQISCDGSCKEKVS